MGYSTDFEGKLKIEPALKQEQINYINKFSETRRMKRNAQIAAGLPDPVRLEAGLPIGHEGAYYVGASGDFGQEKDASIIDYNRPPGNEDMVSIGKIDIDKTQPSLWCQWVVSEDGTELSWDGGEKFYRYVQWLEYLILHFFSEWGVKLNGEISWRGEDSGDEGTIIVENNKVSTKE